MLVDGEAGQPMVTVSFKTDAHALDTPAAYLKHVQVCVRASKWLSSARSHGACARSTLAWRFRSYAHVRWLRSTGLGTRIRMAACAFNSLAACAYVAASDRCSVARRDQWPQRRSRRAGLTRRNAGYTRRC